MHDTQTDKTKPYFNAITLTLTYFKSLNRERQEEQFDTVNDTLK